MSEGKEIKQIQVPQWLQKIKPPPGLSGVGEVDPGEPVNFEEPGRTPMEELGKPTFREILGES